MKLLAIALMSLVGMGAETATKSDFVAGRYSVNKQYDLPSASVMFIECEGLKDCLIPVVTSHTKDAEEAVVEVFYQTFMPQKDGVPLRLLRHKQVVVSMVSDGDATSDEAMDGVPINDIAGVKVRLLQRVSIADYNKGSVQ